MAGKTTPEQDAQACLDAIAALEAPDRDIAQAIHDIVQTSAPMLTPHTFYGMPAYQLDGKNVLFFQSGIKYKTRYCTLGFSQAANLDDGEMWPTSFAITNWNTSTAQRVLELISKAATQK